MDEYNPLIQEQMDELRYRNMTDEEFFHTLMVEASTVLELEAQRRLEILLGDD